MWQVRLEWHGVCADACSAWQVRLVDAPVAGHEAMSHDTKVAITTEHPHFSFLMYGGFVYLDAEGKAVQISAVELSVHGDSNSISSPLRPKSKSEATENDLQNSGS